MFGEFLAKVVSAPSRIAAVPFRVCGALMDENPRDNPFDDLADETEKIVKRVVES